MARSIFDSVSERRLFGKLQSRWSEYVEVYTQIPVRNVIGYDELKRLYLPDKAQDYLLRTAFDFVVCETGSSAPILVVEFDGLSGGFSRDGKYVVNSVPPSDPYRKLKMERKLEACRNSGVPMVVVSYKECELLRESSDYLMVLDAIIGQALEAQYLRENYRRHSRELSQAMERGGREAVDACAMEIDFWAEQENPIKNKTEQIAKQFPYWDYQIVFPQKGPDGLLEGDFYLQCALEVRGRRGRHKVLESVHTAMRDVNTDGCASWEVFNSIGRYCLARKIEKNLGSDLEKWGAAQEAAQWIDF